MKLDEFRVIKEGAVMSRVLLCMAFATAAFATAADTLVVTNTTGITRISDASYAGGIVADTPHQTEYPSDVGDPIFWLDCATTNGWVIAANGAVTKIPSRTGDRYLSHEKGNTTGITGVGSGSWQGPVFVAEDPDLDGPALDFGTKGTYRVLLFNPVGPEGATTNMLEGIGSVFAVYYTARGSGDPFGEGGYYGGGFLGGGFGTKPGYALYRSTSNSRQLAGETGSYRPRWYENAIFGSSTYFAWLEGIIRQDGQVTRPAQVGFSGGWEILALSPNTNYWLPNATGFGMNDSRVGMTFGGFKIAEYIIFDHKLSENETLRVEDYLREKWFSSRAARGRNGDARISWLRVGKNAAGKVDGAVMLVDVPAGEKLTIGRLTGGNGLKEAAIVKSGAGTLDVQDADGYCGDLKMNGGTLAFSRRPVPTTLPRDISLHFDASEADSIVTNESGKVMVWRNLTDEVYKLNPICAARPPAEANAPTLVADELGAGLHVLDFGDFSSSLGNGCYLRFATNETETLSASYASLECPITLIAVVGAQRGGGRAIVGATGYRSSAFSRHEDITCRYSQRLIGNYYYANSNDGSVLVEYYTYAGKYDTVFIDGIESDCIKLGYLTPGYQVVAIRSPGNRLADCIGALDNGSGGFRLAELAVWRRVLTDEEMKDASACMLKKWLNREAPGYARFKTDGVADVQKVTAVADTVIDVPEGTARIGTLASTGGRIVKTGSGTLEVQKIDAMEVAVEGGQVVQVAKSDVCADHKLDDDSWLAAAPSLHLDAADQSSMMIREVNGERRVLAWHSDDKGVLACPPYGDGSAVTTYGSDVHTPYLSSEVQLAGHDTVDFGPFTQAAGGRSMLLSRSFDSVRSVFVVWAPRDDSRGCPLGCSYDTVDGSNVNLYNFLRASSDPAALVNSGNDTTYMVVTGEIYTNGTATAASCVPEAGEFTLTEFHPAGRAHVSAIGLGQNSTAQAGGIRMAEIVLYERELTEREKLATRNYLMKKWFDKEPTSLPEPEPVTSQLINIEVDGETELQVDAGIDATRVVGAGTLEKVGAGTLSIQDLSAFDGTVSVAEGSVALVGQRPAGVGGLVTDGLTFRMDAAQGLTTTTNASGVVSVDKWESTLGDGWAAEPIVAENQPTLISDISLGGHGVINFKRGDATTGQAMNLTYNGEPQALSGMHTVFWVIGSQGGGNTLLGGGTNGTGDAVFNFLRPRIDHLDGYFHLSDPILNGVQYWTVPESIRNADWRMDGTNITATATEFSGEWDLISMTIPGDKLPANADGLAIAGRAGGWQNFRGGQRLAEVLVYNRALGDEERESVNNYLRTKWGVYGYQALPTNSTSVAVASGATLDLGGNEQYVAAISGAGTVQNGTIVVGELLADPTLADRPTVNCTLALEDGVVVRIENAGEISASTAIPILSATAVTGLVETRSTLVFAGDTSWAGAYSARLAFEDGTLFLRFKPRGFTLLVK